jgi:hypothetical protein
MFSFFEAVVMEILIAIDDMLKSYLFVQTQRDFKKLS